MVLPCGGSKPAAGPSSRFDGTSDVSKFLFTFENVLARDLPNKDPARETMRNLDGAAFDLYYENFASDGELTADDLEYDTVKEMLFKTFDCQKNPQDAIPAAVSASLELSNLGTSLCKKNALLRRTEFNESPNIGLLRQAVM